MTQKRILQLAILAQLDIWQNAKKKLEAEPASEQLQRKVDWAWKDAKTLAAMLRTENEETPEEFRNVFH